MGVHKKAKARKWIEGHWFKSAWIQGNFYKPEYIISPIRAIALLPDSAHNNQDRWASACSAMRTCTELDSPNNALPLLDCVKGAFEEGPAGEPIFVLTLQYYAPSQLGMNSFYREDPSLESRQRSLIKLGVERGRRDELKDSVPALEGKEGKDVPSIVNVVSFINSALRLRRNERKRCPTTNVHGIKRGTQDGVPRAKESISSLSTKAKSDFRPVRAFPFLLTFATTPPVTLALWLLVTAPSEPRSTSGGSSISVEVRPLASKVGAKHLAKSSSPFAGMIPSKGKSKGSLRAKGSLDLLFLPDLKRKGMRMGAEKEGKKERVRRRRATSAYFFSIQIRLVFMPRQGKLDSSIAIAGEPGKLD
ncbi:hypothetical protein VNO77_46245 [Canavalia gladiata]|uniref:Uncharacterized protein n=1 Tax=Canavalia gladiata TaxID=3824 RepID=A0AAN9JBK0_CANGL